MKILQCERVRLGQNESCADVTPDDKTYWCYACKRKAEHANQR